MKEYLIVYSDQSSQWSFESVTAMCRYELNVNMLNIVQINSCI